LTLSAKNIADIRRDYQKALLDEEHTGDNPLLFFRKWFDEALIAKAEEANAMVLSTVSADNKPHSRVVLLKGIDDTGLLFFTNYDSAKGMELAANPHAALVFFWPELERQVRVEGTIEKLSATENDVYFQSRPDGSKIGAWASPQSKVVADRKLLEENFDKYQKEFGTNIPRPEHWGGYRVLPVCIEFWQGRGSRLHDRILFSRNPQGVWDKSRLAP
jgi:pyridoxamine 5'-phosphate oxidase